MFQKKYIWIFVALVLIIVITVIFGANKKNSQQPGASQFSNVQTQVSQPSPTPSSTPASTPEAFTAPAANTPSPVPGGTRGQIICNYQVPATPNEFGSASFESNWNNLLPGKNGTAKLAVCVSVNGSASLMSINAQANGSLINSAPWISRNSDYIFSLYDDHGGDLSDCSGAVLSSCEINTNPR